MRQVGPRWWAAAPSAPAAWSPIAAWSFCWRRCRRRGEVLLRSAQHSWRMAQDYILFSLTILNITVISEQ